MLILLIFLIFFLIINIGYHQKILKLYDNWVLVSFLPNVKDKEYPKKGSIYLRIISNVKIIISNGHAFQNKF